MQFDTCQISKNKKTCYLEHEVIIYTSLINGIIPKSETKGVKLCLSEAETIYVLRICSNFLMLTCTPGVELWP